MDASSRQTLIEHLERRVKHNEARAADRYNWKVADDPQDVVMCFTVALALSEVVAALKAPIVDLVDIPEQPTGELSAAVEWLASGGEKCGVCAVELDGLSMCRRDDCPHPKLRKEAKL
jgi:hypothetical protein